MNARALVKVAEINTARQASPSTQPAPIVIVVPDSVGPYTGRAPSPPALARNLLGGMTPEQIQALRDLLAAVDGDRP